MRKILFLLFIAVSAQVINAQNPNFQWAKRIGGSSTEDSKAITSDTKGNIYITGSFFKTVDFDPGPGTYNLVAPFMKEIFIAKLDSFGNLKWAKNMAGRGRFNSDGLSIITDALGNVYTTGYFSDTVDFDPGIDSFKLYSPYGQAIFISKLDSSGNFVWAKQIGGTNYNNTAYSIGLDSSANIYFTGFFLGNVDFDPNAGTYIISNFSLDMFVCKLDSSGNFKWVRQIRGRGSEIGYALEVDKTGNIYVTGYFQDTCDFDPGPGTYKLVAFGKEDAFILKLNSSGDFVWAKQMGGYGSDRGRALKLDRTGNIYAAGNFDSIVEFNPGGLSHKATSLGYNDIFISKFDTSGNFKWVVSMGGSYDDVCNALATDVHGSIYSTGTFVDTVDFNPGPGFDTLISAGSIDIFISKTDSLGHYEWAKRIGGIYADDGMGIIIDKSENIITTGSFMNTVDFDPGPGIFNLTSSTPYTSDLFIQKMRRCSNSFATIALIGCDSLIVNQQSFKVAGTYIQTIPNYGGCDSIVTLNISFKNSSSSTLMDTACDSIKLNGIMYRTSGIYKQTIGNAVGCDSIVTLYLIIKNSTTSVLFDTACDSVIINNIIYSSSGVYKQKRANSIGCDSIITINLNIKRSSKLILNLIECKRFILNNQVYTSSGTYYQVLPNAAGCDSTLKLTLTIIQIDTSVSRNGNKLTANISAPYYQWIDCISNSRILGETSKSYTALTNGSYAVLIGIGTNNCSDTSSCYTISGVGINKNNQSNSIRIFPNPAHDQLNIELPDKNIGASLKLLSSSGQTVIEKKNLPPNSFILDLSEIANGLYILEINNNDKIFRMRVIKFGTY